MPRLQESPFADDRCSESFSPPFLPPFSKDSPNDLRAAEITTRVANFPLLFLKVLVLIRRETCRYRAGSRCMPLRGSPAGACGRATQVVSAQQDRTFSRSTAPPATTGDE